MASKLKVKNDQIVGIFQSMEYQNMSVDIAAVKAWLDKRNGIIKTFNGVPVDVKNVIEENKLASVHLVQNKDDVKAYKYNSKWSTLTSTERTNAMKKFANLIEKNSDLLTNIEAVTRGILPADTKKHGINMISQYLQYYANWTSIHTATEHTAYVIYLPDYSPLTALALALGVPLALGQSVILHSGPNISLSLALIIELSEQAGIPEGTIQLIPGDCLNIVTETLKPSGVFINGNCHAYIDSHPGTLPSSVIAVPNGKTSMIVFDDSDLDSACDAAVNAIWEYQGMLPWSVGTLIVQEDVLPAFIAKLKLKMKKVGQGTNPDCSCESTNFYNSPKQTEKLQEMLKEARGQGVEVFQPTDSKNFQPTLFIGGKVYGNNVIIEDRNNLPVGVVLAFRTPKEAAALANNTRQGLAASVWCQNISLVNEIVRKLDVGTVWVNSHGIVKANIAFATKKNDGLGYIGGLEGLYEYIDKVELTSPELNTSVFDVTSLTKAQQSWCNLPAQVKIEKLLACVNAVENMKPPLPNSEEWINAIRNSVQEYSKINTSVQVENFDLKVYCEPIGVIIVKSAENVPKIVTAALLLGNAVVLDNMLNITSDVDTIAKTLPPGILLNMPWTVSASLEKCKHSIITDTKISAGLKTYCPRTCDLKSMLRWCTMPKNVWTDIGDSF